MSIYASKTPRDLKHDDQPYVSTYGFDVGERYHVADPSSMLRRRFDPRPELDHVQHNAPNPILARFRRWVEGETLADPCWATEWLEAMADPNAENAASAVLDDLYAAPYRRRERAEQEEHARRVISRIQRLSA
ncbi:hypothetical protein SK224_08250 [Microbacterium sp. BG28]|uniref:hypothetical protein n=1 Tax=Microbacterium sp. BG28 TaxID=3097356 RepID=UPI002A5A3A10|nr:hypothetical protein [Microbacterium sp. BG28]MDY0829118.1 hypothetical protein [Microbacterium sp. BG28]